MGRGMWILAAILAVLAISQIYMAETGQLDRPWEECEESLFTQVFSNTCTPRDGGLAPSTAGNAPATGSDSDLPPVDDGVTRVDRGQ